MPLDVWQICLRAVLFHTIKLNISSQTAVRDLARVSEANLKNWDETSAVLLHAMSNLLSTYFRKVNSTPVFKAAWSEFLEHLRQYLHLKSHALGTAAFRAITSVLSQLKTSHAMPDSSIVETAELWRSYLGCSQDWYANQGQAREAFVAYTDAFESIYRLSYESITPHIPLMLPNFEKCLISSDNEAIPSDAEHMSVLQTRILDCFAMIRSNFPGIPPVLIQILGRLSLLPVTVVTTRPGKKPPTFLALSRASMRLLETTLVKHIEEQDVYSSGAFQCALSSLVRLIRQKSIRSSHGKLPPPLATSYHDSNRSIISRFENDQFSSTSEYNSFKHLGTDH